MWPGCVERQTNGTDMSQPPSGTKSKLPRSTFSVLWYWVDLKSDLLLSWAPRPNTAGAKPARLNGRVHEAQTIGPKPANSLPAGELSPMLQQTHTGPFQDLLWTSSHRVDSSMGYPTQRPHPSPGQAYRAQCLSSIPMPPRQMRRSSSGSLIRERLCMGFQR